MKTRCEKLADCRISSRNVVWRQRSSVQDDGASAVPIGTVAELAARIATGRSACTLNGPLGCLACVSAFYGRQRMHPNV